MHKCLRKLNELDGQEAGNLTTNFKKMSIPTPCPALPSPPHHAGFTLIGPLVKREMWSLFNFLGVRGDIWPQIGMFVSGSGELEFEF